MSDVRSSGDENRSNPHDLHSPMEVTNPQAVTRPVTPDFLLVVFIHGFKGNDETFGPFPEYMQHILKASIPDVAVECIVFPQNETGDVLSEAVDRFAEWLVTLTVEREVRHGTGDGAGRAKIVLCGYSMGGLLAADMLIRLADTRPDASALLLPRVIALIAFDTPYLGLDPSALENRAPQTAEAGYGLWKNIPSLVKKGAPTLATVAHALEVGSTAITSAESGAPTLTTVARALRASTTATATAAAVKALPAPSPRERLDTPAPAPAPAPKQSRWTRLAAPLPAPALSLWQRFAASAPAPEPSLWQRLTTSAPVPAPSLWQRLTAAAPVPEPSLWQRLTTSAPAAAPSLWQRLAASAPAAAPAFWQRFAASAPAPDPSLWQRLTAAVPAPDPSLWENLATPAAYALGSALLVVALRAACAQRADTANANARGWVDAHLRYVSHLWDARELCARLRRVGELENELGVRFRAYYTRVAPPTPDSSRPRTFCAIPPADEPGAAHWVPALNALVDSEILAHAGMFERRTNDGYYQLGFDTAALIREAVMAGRRL